jgi:hypothetical protein
LIEASGHVAVWTKGIREPLCECIEWISSIQ